jgi:hypothetical protein
MKRSDPARRPLMGQSGRAGDSMGQLRISRGPSKSPLCGPNQVAYQETQLFLHRNDWLAGAFTRVVPACFVVSKSRIELNCIDCGGPSRSTSS